MIRTSACRRFGQRHLGSYVWRGGEPKTVTDSTIYRGTTPTIHADPEDARTRHPARKSAMEVAAVILFGSVVLWFIEEAADEHV